MNFRQMEYILFVAQEGNITRAASKLHIAQPSLSQTIRTAEKELGGPIFQRRSQPLTPTQLGERYLAVSRQILHLRDDFLNEARDVSEGAVGRTVVGISLRRSREIVPDLLKELSSHMPQLQIQLTHGKSSALERMVLRGEVDVAFIHYESVQPQIECIPLCDEELLLAVSPRSPLVKALWDYRPFSPDYPNSPQIPVSLLEGVPLTLLSEGNYSRDQCDKMFRSAKLVPNIFINAESSELALDVAAATGGCTIIPHIVRARRTVQTGLTLYRIDNPYARRGFYMIYNSSGYVSAAAKTVMEAAIRSLQ